MLKQEARLGDEADVTKAQMKPCLISELETSDYSMDRLRLHECNPIIYKYIQYIHVFCQPVQTVGRSHHLGVVCFSQESMLAEMRGEHFPPVLSEPKYPWRLL